MHNQLRDCIWNITSSLGPYANFIPNSTCCEMETSRLLPSFPNLRPGDITLYCTSNPLAKFFRESFSITAIDCTTTGEYRHCQLSPSNFMEAKSNTLKLHLKHEAMKYNRNSYQINSTVSVSGKSIIKELNEQNITLLAFTFDDYGSTGPLVDNYFNEIKSLKSINNPENIKSFTNAGIHAYKKGPQCKKLTSLFKQSNKGWKKFHKDKWFGTTYQTIDIQVGKTQSLTKHQLCYNKSY